MEITSVCPYCGKEMRDGAIPAYRQRLAWCPRSEEYGGIVEGDRTPLSRPTGAFGSEYADAGYCEQCKVVVVPVPEIDTLADKLDRKLDEWREKRSARQQVRQAQREEKKREERSKTRREKDPWEV